MTTGAFVFSGQPGAPVLNPVGVVVLSEPGPACERPGKSKHLHSLLHCSKWGFLARAGSPARN